MKPNEGENMQEQNGSQNARCIGVFVSVSALKFIFLLQHVCIHYTVYTKA